MTQTTYVSHRNSLIKEKAALPGNPTIKQAARQLITATRDFLEGLIMCEAEGRLTMTWSTHQHIQKQLARIRHHLSLSRVTPISYNARKAQGFAFEMVHLQEDINNRLDRDRPVIKKMEERIVHCFLMRFSNYHVCTSTNNGCRDSSQPSCPKRSSQQTVDPDVLKGIIRKLSPKTARQTLLSCSWDQIEAIVAYEHHKEANFHSPKPMWDFISNSFPGRHQGMEQLCLHPDDKSYMDFILDGQDPVSDLIEDERWEELANRLRTDLDSLTSSSAYHPCCRLFVGDIRMAIKALADRYSGEKLSAKKAVVPARENEIDVLASDSLAMSLVIIDQPPAMHLTNPASSSTDSDEEDIEFDWDILDQDYPCSCSKWMDGFEIPTLLPTRVNSIPSSAIMSWARSLW